MTTKKLRKYYGNGGLKSISPYGYNCVVDAKQRNVRWRSFGLPNNCHWLGRPKFTHSADRGEDHSNSQTVFAVSSVQKSRGETAQAWLRKRFRIKGVLQLWWVTLHRQPGLLIHPRGGRSHLKGCCQYLRGDT